MIPGAIVILGFEDEEGRDSPALRVDYCNQRNPLAIARLNAYSPAASFRSSKSLYCSCDTYSGASLVKVVGIFI